MTVAELIQSLQELPQDACVIMSWDSFVLGRDSEALAEHQAPIVSNASMGGAVGEPSDPSYVILWPDRDEWADA